MSPPAHGRGPLLVYAGSLAALAWLLVVSLSSDVPDGDGPELATAAVHLGVAHPTGYPLFLLLGHAFTRLPLPLTDPLLRLGLLNALYATAAALCVALCVVTLRRTPTASRITAALAGIVAGIAFATSGGVWMQVRAIEVYPLHLLLVSAVVLGLARFEITGGERDLLLAAAAFALGCAHHVTIVYSGAAAIVYVALRSPRVFVSRTALVAFGMLGCALLLYGVLFYANATTTAVSWGDVHNFSSLWAHLMPSEYAPSMAGWTPAAARRLLDAPAWLVSQMTRPLALVGLMGLALLLLRRTAFAVLLLLIGGLNLLHGAQYLVADFRGYYLAALVPAFVAVGVGLDALAARLPRSERSAPVLLALCLGLVFLEAVGSLRRIPAGPSGGEVYVADVDRTVPTGSIFLTTRDAFVFPLWYAQHVRGQLDGVAVVNVLQAPRSWYQRYLRRRYLWLEINPAKTPDETALRIVASHIEGRPVFERNVFTHWFEPGSRGRRWDGPSFSRPPPDLALINRGRVNQIVPREWAMAGDVCGAAPLEPRSRPAVTAAPPILISSSALLSAQDSDSAFGPLPLGETRLVVTWFEKHEFDPTQPGKKGDPIRHGVQICFFAPDGRRLHTVSLASGEGRRIARLPADRLAGPGRYTVRGCSVGPLGSEANVASDRPCQTLVLERPFELR